ncbi:MAG TPA: hypothetical protein HA252_01675 [Candidatus Diapherotrites archaeon]|uniref:site-specific DNA-methyltransferase (cytosine-N(4)-specific) n=1 Tax=Candidatus Iainarchaeum sp. TaxID=3101447 RepID=A0A7J4JEB9_9ARCH|nr:hypothetical protein [Candidatus Diapherotrites archaeon]HIH16093.1 hypothetical protein [Candidatus Diapherotrites archaeon]
MHEVNLAEAVTFTPNKREPIHNWFYYKEGFSRGLVDYCIDRYRMEEPVLDPFCGSGTTLLACKQRGLMSVGIDVSPLALLAARAKTHAYDLEGLRNAVLELKKLKPEFKGNPPKQDWVRKLFYAKTLENILFYKERIEEMKDELIRDFLLLGLVDTAGRVANAVKAGGSLRREKKPPLPVKKLFFSKLKFMYRDLKKSPPAPERGLPAVEPEAVESDARKTSFVENHFGGLITSPPYLNKIEYTTVYKMELALFFKAQETRLRAFIGEEAADEGGAPATGAGLPPIARAYFEDLEKVLRNCLPALKPGAKAVFNIAGGCFPDQLVESDQLLAELGQRVGFKPVEIIPCRKIQCHALRSMKTGTVNESLVVFEK